MVPGGGGRSQNRIPPEAPAASGAGAGWEASSGTRR